MVNPPFPSFHTGIRLAIEAINNNQAILPNKTLIFEKHNLLGSAQSIATVIEFAERNLTFVAGNEFAALLVQSGIACSVLGIAQFSATASASELADTQTYPYLTRLVSSDSSLVFLLVDTLKYYQRTSGPGWTDVGYISSINEYGTEIADVFFEQASQNDITISTYQQFLVDAPDFDVELNELKRSGARVFVLVMYVARYSDFILAANEYELVGDSYVWFTMSALVGSPIFSTLAPEVQELSRGLIGLFEEIPTSGAAYDEFIYKWTHLDPTDYLGAGPGTFPSAFIRLEYDALVFIGNILDTLDRKGMLQQTGMPPEEWTKLLRETQFSGITGPLEFDDKGDRVIPFTLNYYDPDSSMWKQFAVWTDSAGFTSPVGDVVWFSNTTTVPDLDIRSPFHYWSCYDKEEKFDETGKTVKRHTPDRSDIDEIESTYHCDSFIDCRNMSDESADCSQNYIILFIITGISTGILMLICVALLVFVLIFGILLEYQMLKVASPFFLILMLLSLFVGYSSIFAWFGKPHPVACVFQPWLLGLSAISMITALCVKTFRIWRIFRSALKIQKITDFELLGIWGVVMFPAILIVALWSLVSTPTARMEEWDGVEHYVCTTGGFTGKPGGIIFFSILVAYGVLILLVGVFLSVVTRKVPAIYNESKLLSISIYNIGFLSVVVIPVYFAVQPFNPFIAWILRTVAILYAFTATLILQFTTPVFHIVFLDRLRNKVRNIRTTGH